MSNLEEQKKLILPLLQRAQEIQLAEPTVAYYCRLYAVEQGLQLQNRAKELNAVILSALNQLEIDKKKLTLDASQDKFHCEGFALKIFHNADKVDRAGRATETTSKAYYASSIFLEILSQFGPLAPDLLEKQKYAVWRAAEIRKALREGRTPSIPDAVQESADKQAPAVAEEVETSTGEPLIPDSSPISPPISSFQTPEVLAVNSDVLYFNPGYGMFVDAVVAQFIPPNKYILTLPMGDVEADDYYVFPKLDEGQKVFVDGGGGLVSAEIKFISYTVPMQVLVRTDSGSEFYVDAKSIRSEAADATHRATVVQGATTSSASLDLASLSLATPAADDFAHPSVHSTAPIPPPSSQLSFSMLPSPPAYDAAPPRPLSPTFRPTQASTTAAAAADDAALLHRRSAAAAPSLNGPSAPVSAAPRLPQAPAPAPPPAPAPVAPAGLNLPKSSVPLRDVQQAQKFTKYAVSALSFEDIGTAVDNLQKALRLLTQ